MDTYQAPSVLEKKCTATERGQILVPVKEETFTHIKICKDGGQATYTGWAAVGSPSAYPNSKRNKVGTRRSSGYFSDFSVE